MQTDAERLINGLDMAAFRRQFQAQGNHIELSQFIRIVRHISERSKRRDSVTHLMSLDGLGDEELTARLIELFREIDLDGDGKVVWEEFTRFILDKATQVGRQATEVPDAYVSQL
jgi:Ca2+-binding EF-hand superfamily protein